MDDIRQSVIKLNEKFKKLAIADEAMKEVISCNSKNLEALKNYTLDLNERIGVIEDGMKTNINATGDLIIEKVERIKRELADLDDRIDTVEDKLTEDIESTAAKIYENLSYSNDKQTQQNKLLGELVSENERKLKEVEVKLLDQKKLMKENVPVFKCDECGKSFQTKIDRKSHISEDHPKQFSCEFCHLSFCESWRYEVHLETHSKPKDKKCEVCGKEFFMEWQLRQHINVHENTNIKKCHYFNNNKVCPFDHVGCKFKHEKSKQCSKPNNCNVKLCPKQHPVI